MVRQGLWKIQSHVYPLYDLGLIYEYVSMFDELGLGNGRLLFSHFKISCTSLDDSVIASLSQDDMDMPWGMVAPDTDDDASISELEADEVKLELKDAVADTYIFAYLDQAYEEDEDFDSYLDEALVLEEADDSGMFDNSVVYAYEEDIDSQLGEALVLKEVGDLGFFDNLCAQMVYREIGEREVDDQLFLGDPIDNEMTKHDAINNSCSNVPIGRPRKRKKVEYDETDSVYDPIRNPMKRRKLNKDERYVTDFVDDVEKNEMIARSDEQQKRPLECIASWVSSGS
ncbi:hypothetical protein Tco_0111902 [Tanacetum coccineum]